MNPLTPGTTPTYDRRPSKVFDLDRITGCSPGCALSGAQVEEVLAFRYQVVPGPVTFRVDAATSEENTAHFTLRLRDGRCLLGIVVVKVVVERDKMTAYSDIRLLRPRP